MTANKNTSFRPSLLALEGRELMASALVASYDAMQKILTVNGSAGDDQVTVAFTNDNKVFVNDNVKNETVPIRYNNNPNAPMPFIRQSDLGQFPLNVPTSAVQVYGRDGNDLIRVEEGTNAKSPRCYMDGGRGNDSLMAGSASDILFGGEGDDFLLVGGIDSADGGPGTDTLGANTQFGGWLSNDRYDPWPTWPGVMPSLGTCDRLASIEKAYLRVNGNRCDLQATQFSGKVTVSSAVAGYDYVEMQGVDLKVDFNFTLRPDVAAVYKSLGGPMGSLGAPTSCVVYINGDNGMTNCVATFANGGAIVSQTGKGAHYMSRYIYGRWNGLGGGASVLGFPVSDEYTPASGLKAIRFTQGILVSPGVIGTYEVHGAIYDKYMSLGGPAVLGRPLHDERVAPDGVGRFSAFQGGSIYWTPTTGAQLVYGAIRDKWAEKGWERNGELGYPTSDEMDAPGGGRVSHFQHGDIYWHPSTGAHIITGRNGGANGWCLQRFNLYGGINTFGYPKTDSYEISNDSFHRVTIVDFQRGYIAQSTRYVEVLSVSFSSWQQSTSSWWIHEDFPSYEGYRFYPHFVR